MNFLLNAMPQPIRPLLLLTILGAGVLLGLCASADEGIVPPSAMRLSRVLHRLENQGIRPVRVGVEGRRWVVDGVGKKSSIRTWINPDNGGTIKTEEIDPLEPIESPLSMSKVVRRIEEANPGPIYRVHFAEDLWVIETRRGKTITQVKLNSKTGNLVMGKDEK